MPPPAMNRPANRPAEPGARAGRRRALLWLHLAVMLFGLAGLFGKWLTLPPTAIVLGRTAIAALTLATLLLVARGRLARFDGRYALTGAILAVHWLTFFQAIQVSTVAIGLLGFASFPIFVLLIESGVLRLRRSAGDWLLAGTVVLGLVVLVPEFNIDNRAVQGLAWGLASALSFAALTVANRLMAARRPAIDIAFWQSTCAAICVLPFTGGSIEYAGARDIALLLLLGIVCTALAHTLFVRSLRTLPAHTASFVTALEPVYGIALAALLLREMPDTRVLAGAVLIVGAAAATTWRAART